MISCFREFAGTAFTILFLRIVTNLYNRCQGQIPGWIALGDMKVVYH